MAKMTPFLMKKRGFLPFYCDFGKVKKLYRPAFWADLAAEFDPELSKKMRDQVRWPEAHGASRTRGAEAICDAKSLGRGASE
jgi:hypothetical protein